MRDYEWDFLNRHNDRADADKPVREFVVRHDAYGMDEQWTVKARSHGGAASKYTEDGVREGADSMGGIVAVTDPSGVTEFFCIDDTPRTISQHTWKETPRWWAPPVTDEEPKPYRCPNTMDMFDGLESATHPTPGDSK